MNELRPDRFDSLIGQSKLIKSLKISVASANSRSDALSHALISGPPGLGKTTIANALANELGVEIQVANGANLRSVKSLVPYVLRTKERSILFIDEVHRMTKLAAEFLYPIMEDFKLDMAVEGKTAESGKVMSIPLPKFTVIGATTEAGSLPAPFRDRFKLKYTLELYDTESLSKLIKGNCKKLNVNMTNEAIETLAKASRGTPRIANGLLEWIRDYQVALSLNSISEDSLIDALEMRGYNKDGSTENDMKYLEFLKSRNGDPVGIGTICSTLNLDKDTVEDVIEPYLLRKGLIAKTTKGRIYLTQENASV